MRSSRLLAGVTAAAIFAAALTIGWGLDHSPGFAQGATGAPPFDLSDSKVIGEGAQLFRQSCTAYCHGKDGGPSRAPKLRGAKLERGYVYARISKGSPNGMPGFEAMMPRDNIWKLVAYVMSLGNAEDK
ncbi:MAG TPA: cytochrome c [Methylomirabilota bacterium]|nr:cytochrome c [Methylomirabilota bacterium]